MRAAIAALAAALVGVFAPASALAAPPAVSNTNFAEVGQSAATLSASVDPAGANVEARFDYTTLAAFQASGFEGAQSAPAGGILVPSKVKGKGDLQEGSQTIAHLSTEAGTFGPGETLVAGGGIQAETMIVEVKEEAGGGLALVISKAATATEPGRALTATGPQPVVFRLEGLSPATAYVFRAAAQKTSGAKEEAQSPPLAFSTLGPAPLFAPCPNDEFRSGALAPAGQPGAHLPDCRSFELASPLAKNGNDILRYPGYVRAGPDGTVTFGVTFGIPGGVGAQRTPFYLATRNADGSGWSTSGVLPPEALGEETSFLVGQLPDLSATYAAATHLGDPSRSALFELHSDGSPPTQITPYVVVPNTSTIFNFGFAGASTDANTLLIEARQALPAEEGGPPIPGSVAEAPNVYAWDRATGQLHLASVMNTEEETQEALAKGAFAGPYNWFSELKQEGGAIGHYYLAEEHAVSEDGSILFTSASDGKLYQRLHPTQPQSALDSEGRCTEAQMACTIAVSASHRAEPDPAGEEPAALQAATADGSQVLFTSHEKLTNDANTGPEAAKAAIGRATLHGEEPADGENDQFLPTHALGLAVDPKGEFIYWADPSRGTIARAKLDPSGDLVPGSTEAEYVVPGETEAEIHQVSEPGVKTKAPTKPRYVAVGPCAEGGECVYWTNTGPAGEKVNREEAPTIDGQGTIGRARIGPGQGEDPEPEFITGASNPQGIAVNAEHIYWANAANDALRRQIGRAEIDGTEVEQKFVDPRTSRFPYGLALDSSYLYFTADEVQNKNGLLYRVPLAGGEGEQIGIGEDGVRGLALAGKDLYWNAQKEGAIGQIPADEITTANNCFQGQAENCEKQFLTPPGQLEGLASDPSGEHLFWSANGEAPKNPGNDLYRFTRAPEPGGEGTLEDLTAVPTGNGAEVQGVLGISADGNYVYLAANADLDGSGPAKPGDCRGRFFQNPTGECSIYLLHEGQFHLVARVRVNDFGEARSDAEDWLAQADPSRGVEKSSLVSADGSTLVFRSKRQLTGYENHGTPELYRYRLGEEPITCLTCVPSGEAPSKEPTFGSGGYPFLNPGTSLGTYRLGFASEDGNRLFFETPDALVAEDTDGLGGCPMVPEHNNAGTFNNAPRCLDVYEWEAAGSGSCALGAPGYYVQDEGCIYLISTDTKGPAVFLDASPSGKDLYFITRSKLVGEDSDELTDVYDARVGGGIAAQNQPPPPPPCEGEGCKSAASPPPTFQAPPSFSGPANPKPRRCHGRRCHRKGHHNKKHRKAKHRVGGTK